MGGSARATVLGVRTPAGRRRGAERESDEPEIPSRDCHLEEAAGRRGQSDRPDDCARDSLALMSVILGIAGASRNAAVALCHGGRVVGVCEHARITRTRRAALLQGQLPRETLQTILQLGCVSEDDVSAYALAEAAIQLPSDRPIAYVDNHLAHAATAFYTSPLKDATIIVCDRGGSPELTVWRGSETGIRREEFSWSGPAFASVYTQATEAMGFGRDGDEHRLEALARVGEHRCDAAVPTIRYCGDHLDIPSHFQASIASVIGQNGSAASGSQ